MAFLQSEELLKLQQDCETLRLKVNPKGHFMGKFMNGNCEENKMNSKSILTKDSVCYSRESTLVKRESSETNFYETNLDFSSVCQTTNEEKDIKVYCLEGLKKICLDKECTKSG